MRLGLSILASRRPAYFRQVMEALALCEGLRQWHARIVLDDADTETLRLARDPMPWASREIVHLDMTHPTSADERAAFANAHERIAFGTRSSLRVEGTPDFVVHLEDDCVPAPGFLEWCRGLAITLRDDPNVFAVCGYRRDVLGLPLEFVPHFVPWGWATWGDRLDEILRDVGRAPGQQWDERVQELRGERLVVFPSSPLIRNIGRIGTTPADVYDREQIGGVSDGTTAQGR